MARWYSHVNLCNLNPSFSYFLFPFSLMEGHEKNIKSLSPSLSLCRVCKEERKEERDSYKCPFPKDKNLRHAYG